MKCTIIDEIRYYKALVKTFINAIDLGYYPEKNNSTSRTERQEGWNECLLECRKSIIKYSKKCQTNDHNQIWKMKIIMIGSNEGFWGDEDKFYLNMNDIFSWGCADAEEVSDLEIPFLYKLYEDFGDLGCIAWVCYKRGDRPQKIVLDKIGKEKLEEVINYIKENIN